MTSASHGTMPNPSLRLLERVLARRRMKAVAALARTNAEAIAARRQLETLRERSAGRRAAEARTLGCAIAAADLATILAAQQLAQEGRRTAIEEALAIDEAWAIERDREAKRRAAACHLVRIDERASLLERHRARSHRAPDEGGDSRSGGAAFLRAGANA